MARKAKYHQLTQEEQVQFHFARYLYALALGDYFEAYRQSCIAAARAKQLKDFRDWQAKRLTQPSRAA